MRQAFAIALGALAIGAILTTAPAVMAQAANSGAHPAILSARQSLVQAHEALIVKHVGHNFHGHRRDAIKQIDLALIELDEAIKFGHGVPPGGEGQTRKEVQSIDQGVRITREGSPAVPGNLAGKSHPEVRDGLRLCRQAKAELAKSAHDFGGHRSAAMLHIDHAISHLRLALAGQ